MKTCSYCGAEYPDDIAACPIDQTPLADGSAAPAADSPPVPEPPRAEYEFAPLTAEQRQQDLVTLVRCATLVAADMVASRLRAAGIEAFIPDENLMQSIGFNLNTFGYVRVQVAPEDYETARSVISEC
jgi:cell division septation protein DedD